MAGGNPGQPPRLDPATQSLRQALLQAEDDAQRRQALEVIAQRTIFAPTWANSPDAVRTLTNSESEHAMPLFSALDTLQAAARRFGWMRGDGSLSFRELSAREALRSALDQGVHYVVIDMFAEHATEFSREEIAYVMSRVPPKQAAAARAGAPVPKQAAGAPAQAAPAQAAPAQGAPARAHGQAKPNSAPIAPAKARPASAGLAEMDMPFTRERVPAKPIARVAIEPAVVPARRDLSPRIDPRAEPETPRAAGRAAPEAPRAMRQAAARALEPRPESAVIGEAAANAYAAAARAHASATRAETAPAAPPRPAVLRAPSTLKEQPAPRAERPPNPTPGAFAPPRADRAPNPTPGAFTAPRADRAPNPTPGAFAPPRADRAPNPTPDAFAPPSLPVLESIPAHAQPPTRHGQAWNAPAQQAPFAPSHAALPTLDEPTAEPSSRDTGFSFDGLPQPEANPGALEAAAMIAQVGRLARDADTQKAAADVAAMLKDMARKGVVEEAKPSAAQSAAKVLAGMLSAEAAVDAQRGKRGRPAEPESAQQAAAPASAASAAEGSGLRALDPPMQSAVLDAISDALRKYPEVEWACEVSDGSETPVIGLRVDPAFQSRAAEIRAAVIAAAQGRKTRLSVLMLDNPQVMKDARVSGSAFFPWRKRAAKR